MDRNWLIRTSQNQILGPVAKQKLLEFIQKGALGMTDEVTSGNGYWFSLKEKELVEKYLYGDIPQSYNPISESKSVLSKRENPEKTTSINTAPANKTQLIKANNNPGIAPAADDLAFPDVTVVHTLPKDFNSPAASVAVAIDDETKLPSADDLAFPDMDAMLAASKNENQPFLYAGSPPAKPVEATVVVNNSHAGAASARAPIVVASDSGEDVALPNEDDLAFPDMDDLKTSTKIEKGKVDLSHQYTRTVALDNSQSSAVLPEKVDVPEVAPVKGKPQEIEDDFGTFKLALDLTAKEKMHFPDEVREQPLQAAAKKERPVVQPSDDRKLLHDRKTKSSVATTTTKSPAAMRDPNREVVHGHSHAEPLKKRNDNYLFFILIIVLMIIIAVFFYFKEILNKPLPV